MEGRLQFQDSRVVCVSNLSRSVTEAEQLYSCLIFRFLHAHIVAVSSAMLEAIEKQGEARCTLGQAKGSTSATTVIPLFALYTVYQT